jgi:hypothetical protein
VVTFYIDLNYIDPRNKHYYFVSTGVDSNSLEGPPSDLSSEIIVKPGQALKLNVDEGGGATANLYRSVPGTGKFYLIEEQMSAGTWTDDGSPAQPIELPPYGNYNDPSDLTSVSTADSMGTLFTCPITTGIMCGPRNMLYSLAVNPSVPLHCPAARSSSLRGTIRGEFPDQILRPWPSI